MNIFGWTFTVRRTVTPHQLRADRNAAAMVGSLGAAALPGTQLGARIHRDEIALAESLLRMALAENRAVRRAYPHGTYTDLGFDPDQFVATMHQRLGAAAAVEADVQFAAILPQEVAMIEAAVIDLHADAGIKLGTHLRRPGRELVEDLHQRLGHAHAVRFLGEVPVLSSTASETGTR